MVHYMRKTVKFLSQLFVVIFLLSSAYIAPSCFNVEGKGVNEVDFQRMPQDTVISEGESSSFEIDVNVDGNYNILLKVLEESQKFNASVVDLSIDGQDSPEENKEIEIERNYFNPVQKDRENAFKKDSQGNELVPDTYICNGYYDVILRPNALFADNYLSVELQKGKHIITLTSKKGDLVINSLSVVKQNEALPYKKNTASASISFSEIYEGELYNSKSSSEIVPVYDRTSPSTSPSNPSKIRLNYIGGSNWSKAGEWIEWIINVPQDGYYKIGMRYRQNINSGSISSRRLYIDGKVPFKEVGNIKFGYNSNWQTEVLGDGKEEYQFYLNKGEHRIRLECTLGELSELLEETQKIVFSLNDAYRKVVKLTGTSPDTYRDYGLDKLIPEVFDVFEEKSAELKKVNSSLEKTAGKRGSANTTIDNLTTQLDEFCTDHKKLQKELDDFKSNIGSLATWIFTLIEQPLDIDYIWVGSYEKEFEAEKDSFFTKVWYEIKAFVASFFEDYSVVSDDANTKQLEVWLQSGREQANVLRNLIVNKFTPQTNIGVKIKVVQNSVIANNASGQNQLMMSIMSGNGPDVAVSVPSSDPVNYGIRNAAVDLRNFSDYEEVIKRFHPESTIPYTYDNKTYALPETLNFPVMFYRRDILNEIGMELPETWDDVCEIAGLLQKDYMDIVIPANDTSGIFSSVSMFIYQNGCDLYTEDGKQVLLNNPKAIDSFVLFANLFNSYRLPVKYDLANRFRTGEVPIAIVDYTFANQISVYAPEIRGLWDFTTVPGIKDSNGNINNTVPLGGVATVMFSATDDEQSAWEFMKWWSSEEIQAEFGRKIEGIQGIAARYNTANINAISKLSWSTNQYNSLMRQMKNLKAVPEVPGGYLTSRYIETAFRRVTNQNYDPRDVMDEFAILINDELTYKRNELGLK
mgnify:FL=1